MARGSAFVYELAAVDLVGAPSRNAVSLDAVLRDEIVGVPLDLRRHLAPTLPPTRKPGQRRQK